jgi:hypothetical protein
MRSLVIVVSLLAGLVLASTASAKELAGATICGADGCQTAGTDRELDRILPEGSAAGPPEPAPFLRVSLTFRGEEDETVTVGEVFVPSAGVMGSEGGWTLLAPESLAGLERLAEGLDPLPASQLSAAVQEVGGAPLEAAAPPPDDPAPPPPADRSSSAGVVLVMGALVLLLGLAAVVQERRNRGAGPLPG